MINNDYEKSTILFHSDASADGGGAYDAKIKGIYYNFNLTAKTATVTYCSSGNNYEENRYAYSDTVNIPATVNYNGEQYSVTSIGSSAFSGCSGLTSVTIPNSVTSIGDGAFAACGGLTSITIPNSVTIIGNQAFYGCSGLNSVTIGNNVTSIGNWAFQGCSSLTSITIPNSVKGIGQEAFRGCSGLTSVTIGSGVKTIDSQAFAYCKELTDVYCLAENVPSTSTDAFNESLIEYATLHVPTSSIDAYRAKEPWKSFKEIKSLTGEDVPVTPDPEKCATPTIAFVDGKLKFNCETEDVEFVYDIKSTYSVHGVGSEVVPVCKCTVTVYATRQDYYNSDVATLEFTLGADGDVCDTNKDGVVDVADIATIIDKMAGK
ncbi:MAG: leucine-rich repeat domain-containing protein [Prevotella sp.]|nr:leucine-rich repeat domain-containing protein [Prevotella sp.]